MFLALLEDTLVAAILKNIGIDPLLVRNDIEEKCGRSMTYDAPPAKPCFQRRLDILIELAGDIRKWFGGSAVGPHHLLLALLNDPHRFPASMLKTPGPSHTDIYGKILETLRTRRARLKPEQQYLGDRGTLGELLEEMELVTEGQFREALEVQRAQGGAIGDILVELGHINREELLLALGSKMGMEVANLEKMEIPPQVIGMVPPEMARAFNVIPIKFEDGVLTVAMANPHDINVLDDLRHMCRCEIHAMVASEEAVLRALEKYYAHKTENLGSFLDKLGDCDLTFQEVKDPKNRGEAHTIEGLISSAPVVKLLNLILATAIKAQSSDIHFEMFETEFKVRYRVDGVLYEMEPPPLHLAPAMISRLKLLAGLDFTEHQLPQDGRIDLSLEGFPYRLQVSTLPTAFGESVVVHVFKET